MTRSMPLAYPVKLETEGGNSVLVSFPDIPEALTEGSTKREALAEARDCLIAALGGYIEGPARHSAAVTGEGTSARRAARAGRRQDRTLPRDARARARQRGVGEAIGDRGRNRAASARPRSPVAYRPGRGGASRPRTAAGGSDTGRVGMPLGAEPRFPVNIFGSKECGGARGVAPRPGPDHRPLRPPRQRPRQGRRQPHRQQDRQRCRVMETVSKHKLPDSMFLNVPCGLRLTPPAQRLVERQGIWRGEGRRSSAEIREQNPTTPRPPMRPSCGRWPMPCAARWTRPSTSMSSSG